MTMISKLRLFISCLFLCNLLLGNSAIYIDHSFYTPTSSLTQTGIKKNEENNVSKDQFKDYLKSKSVRFIENKFTNNKRDLKYVFLFFIFIFNYCKKEDVLCFCVIYDSRIGIESNLLCKK